MKVLQFISSLNIGGAEKLILDITPRLIEKGISCDVLVVKDIETSFKNELISQGIKVHCLSKKRGFYNPLNIFSLIPYLKKYDIIHAHLFSSIYLSAIAKLLTKADIRLIATEHNTDNNRRHIKLLKPIEKIIYNRYHKIIAISEVASSNLKMHIGLDDKITTIENGVDVNKFSQAIKRNKTHYGFYDTDYVITMVGGFRPQKDQDTLIKSLVHLPEEFKLNLVGDGVRRNECEGLVNKLDLGNRVKFMGIRNDIPEILKMSDIIVMSSHYEGLSLSSLEAMSSGKPFIASDVPGLKEITEGVGMLFKEGDDEEFADIVIKLHGNSELYKKIAESCYNQAVKYDVDNMLVKMIDLYKTII